MPEVAFTAYEEPFEDKLGTTCTYVPGLGTYKTGCDCYGTPVIERPQVLKWLGASTAQRDENLGVPWIAAIAAMPAGEVAEADFFATQWNYRTGQVHVASGDTHGGDLNFTVVGDGKVVDAALADRGFLRTNRWSSITEDKAFWRTDVYKASTT